MKTTLYISDLNEALDDAQSSNYTEYVNNLSE